MAPESDRLRWNARYSTRQPPGTACELLEHCQSLLPSSGCALDLACGLGGNAVLLARRGFVTHAWDVSDVVIDKLQHYARQQGLSIHAECRDLARLDTAEPLFDVIVVSYYLERRLMPWIMQSLKPGGLLYYQTWLQAAPPPGGRLPGPANPAYRLERGELPGLCSGLRILVYLEWPDRQQPVGLTETVQRSGVLQVPEYEVLMVAEKTR